MHSRTLPFLRAFRLSVHLVLTVLIGFGAIVPQAAAYLACSHPCCSTATGSHMQHPHAQIADPTHRSCCTQQPSDDCRFCTFEDFPRPDLAFQTTPGKDDQKAAPLSTARRSLPTEDSVKEGGGPQIVAADLHFPPLYIQTRTLLI